VDADYTKNRVTRWSQTGILIFLYWAPLYGILKLRIL
jgi:hypothetical protein